MKEFNKPAVHLDRAIHAEVQHVKVVIAQVESLRDRHEEGEIRSGYNRVVGCLKALRHDLDQADVQHYEVDAG